MTAKTFQAFMRVIVLNSFPVSCPHRTSFLVALAISATASLTFDMHLVRHYS
jgi:hypothetical protein